MLACNASVPQICVSHQKGKSISESSVRRSRDSVLGRVVGRREKASDATEAAVWVIRLPWRSNAVSVVLNKDGTEIY